MYKKFYSRFINANPEIQHYASHSHHYWPDVTYDAMIEYWNDAARLVDNKWDYILGQKVPETQKLIAEVLNLKNYENICFASNTHELLIRLLSCFNKKIKILTTDSEFYSFSRQTQRLSEMDLAEITYIPTEPFDTFNERFTLEAQKYDYDLVFFSQVFFNSGLAIKNLDLLVNELHSHSKMIIVDGYHGFMALPTDLSTIQDKIFYITGSYKYAQGGEGCCFMSTPSGFSLNPIITGWFAGFENLADTQQQVSFAQDGYRFAGSTMDYSALYRLNAALKLFKTQQITVHIIHQHVQKLQKNFLKHIDEINHIHINQKNLILNDLENHGHFFAFKLPDTESCQKLMRELRQKRIMTDSRKNILRFGFGLYQDDTINLKSV